MLSLAVATAFAGALPLVGPAAADYLFESGDVAVVAGTGGDGLNLRSAPGTDSEVLWSLHESAAMEVVGGPETADDGSAWYQVWALAGDDWVAGWVAADYVGPQGSETAWHDEAGDNLTFASSDFAFADSTLSPADSAEAATGVPITVWADGEGLLLRDGPSFGAEMITGIPEGALVNVLSPNYIDDNGVAWSRVQYDGYVGYTQAAGYATGGWGTEPASDIGYAIVDAATAYVGVPYLWGGMAPDGFDCSGFTWWVLNQDLGFDIGRPMEDQIATGMSVSRDELAPGDVIYFQNTYQWGISHVGFYLGDGLFISATGQYDAVGVSSLYDPYWATRYVTANRIG